MAPRRGRPRERAAAVPQRPEVLGPPITPLYKTRLCSFFELGACRAGPLCTFAHGEEDLRPSPDFERTSVCPVLLRDGSCTDASCRYAHDCGDLRSSPVMLKTKMCSFFLSGACVVGGACRFAHSEEELREAEEVQQDRLPLWERRRLEFLRPKGAAARGPPGLQPPGRPQPAAARERRGRRAGAGAARGSPGAAEDTDQVAEPQVVRPHQQQLQPQPQQQQPKLESQRQLQPQLQPRQWEQLQPQALPQELPRTQQPLQQPKQQASEQPPPPPQPPQPERPPQLLAPLPARPSTPRRAELPPRPALRPAVAEAAPAADGLDDDDLSDSPEVQEAPPVTATLATGAAGRVVIAAATLDADARQDAAVDREGLAWRKARSVWIIAGVGAAVVLQSRIRTLFQRSRAIFDIEDLSEVTNFCETCELNDGGPLMVEVERRGKGLAGDARQPHCQRRHAERSRTRATTGSTCSKDRCRFARCALCSQSGHSHEPCAACNCGLRIVSKNTFLTLDDEAEKQEGAQRRSKSL